MRKTGMEDKRWILFGWLIILIALIAVIMHYTN